MTSKVAYEIYLIRQECDLQGDANLDWQIAEEFLRHYKWIVEQYSISRMLLIWIMEEYYDDIVERLKEKRKGQRCAIVNVARKKK